MARNIFDQMKAKAVIIDAGTFYGEGKKKKYTPAPFRIVVGPSVVNGEESMFLQPVNFSPDLKYLNLTALDNELDALGQAGFGEDTGERIIVEDHYMGAPTNDDWRGVHLFSNI
jgi:hypothetical protein